MKLSNTFVVNQSIDRVWAEFSDVASLVQCLPGATLVADHGDGQYEGSVEVKLGPMTARFDGQAEVRRDDASRSGHISGKGVDRRGGSRGQVKVDYSVVPDENGSEVTVDADVMLSGAIAQFGRTGLVGEITKRLIDEFVDCLEAKMSADTVSEAEDIQAAEVKGLTLLFGGLVAWIRGLFRRLFTRGTM